MKLFKSKESWFTDVRVGEDTPCGGTLKVKYFCSSTKKNGYIIYLSSDDKIHYYKSEKFKKADENLSEMAPIRSYVNVLKNLHSTDENIDSANDLHAMFLNEVINGRFGNARCIVSQIESLFEVDKIIY